MFGLGYLLPMKTPRLHQIHPFSAIFLAGILTMSARTWAGTVTITSLSTILTEMAQEVGGEHVNVVPLVKAGMDPHDYQPQPDDLRKASDSQLILATGKHLENYLPKLSESTGGKAAILQVGDAFPSLQISGEDAVKTGGLDPHWWHSITNMKVAVKTVRDELIALDPTDKDDFDANAAATLARLDALNAWARKEIATLPRDARKLVTSHDAFQYFARDYGFTIYPIEGVTTEDQPSSKKIADLIDTIKTQGVKAVFFENIENPKVIQEITKETGAKVGGELYADGLGTGGEGTYEGMFRHNVTTIVEGLK
jgi:zinc/manganese transport system substrate-binding protein